jgi:hypothetical protein
LLGFMLSNGFPQMATPAFAAAVNAEKGVSATDETSVYDAVSFTERIKKILEDGDKARNVILHGGDNNEKTDRAPQSAPEIPPPVSLQPSERSIEQQPYQQPSAPVQTGNVNACKAIQLIGNLSNRGAYHYDEAHIEKIFEALEQELAATKAKFEPAKEEKSAFSFD